MAQRLQMQVDGLPTHRMKTAGPGSAPQEKDARLSGKVTTALYVDSEFRKTISSV
jgi:hypothetical protein